MSRIHKHRLKPLHILNKIILIFLIIIFLIQIRVNAQIDTEEQSISPALTLAPSIFDLDCERTQILAESISVTNETEFAMPINIQVTDYNQDERGTPDFSEDPSAWSPKTWIEPEFTDIILDANEKRGINLKISIPDYAEPGSHFAAIFFKPVLPPEHFTPHSAHVIPYIGAVVSLNVYLEGYEPVEDYLEITNFESRSSEEKAREFQYVLKNKDIYHHRLDSQISIINVFNNEVGKIQTRDTTVFPNKTRELLDIYTDKLIIGRYDARLVVNDENIHKEQITSFWVLPSAGSVISILSFVGLCMFLILKRNNLKNALLILIKKEKGGASRAYARGSSTCASSPS